MGYETSYNNAPEICVEIVSPSNSKEEILNKTCWYLQVVAKVRKNGLIEYYDESGQLEQSNYIAVVELPKLN